MDIGEFDEVADLADGSGSVSSSDEQDEACEAIYASGMFSAYTAPKVRPPRPAPCPTLKGMNSSRSR